MSLIEEAPRKAGRPPGTYKDPVQSLRLELQSWLSIMQTSKGLIERQLVLFDKKIADVESKAAGFEVDQMLEIMSGLKELMSTSIRLVEAGIKIDAELDGKNSSKRGVGSSEDLTNFLQGGKGG